MKMSITTKHDSVISDAQLEAMAEVFEAGEWPEGATRVVRGRPLKLDEELVSVTFKIPARGTKETKPVHGCGLSRQVLAATPDKPARHRPTR